MPEINLFFDQRPIQVVGVESGKVYAEGAEASCFQILSEQYPSAHGTYPELLRINRLKEKPTDGNQ
ncbi:hypothetical protein [Oceanobacillus kimchii]|uniref:hypothetical protein n=1 Tax=Oceanobacillus kimchii TaxID=746691 RepID=UPI003C706203